jgi:hypothetical protein
MISTVGIVMNNYLGKTLNEVAVANFEIYCDTDLEILKKATEILREKNE